MDKSLWKKITGLLIFAFLVFSSVSCQKLGQEISYTKARNLHDKGHINQAIEIYKNLIKANPKNSEVQYDLGVAYADQRKWSLAENQVSILTDMGRGDLADILRTVIRDGNSSMVRKNLQNQYDQDKAGN